MALFESGSTAGVRVRLTEDGVLHISINANCYKLAGKHWQEQLSGNNRRKWGNIYYFVDPDATRAQRREACYELKGVYRGTDLDLDECPGAMFFWDGPETEAHVLPLPRNDNRSLGGAIGANVTNVIRNFAQSRGRADGRLRADEGFPVDFAFV